MTAGTLIERAMRKIGVLASNQAPTGTESNDALVTLNGLLEALQLEGRTIYTITRVTKAIIASQASYTIGVGGDIVRTRPTAIPKAMLLMTSATPDLELPMKVLSQDEWEDIPNKALTSTLPTCIYYNPTNPLGTMHPWPIPTDPTYSFVLYLEEPLTTLAALTTVLAFPPGYQRMLEYKLAVELSPEYDRPVSPLMMQAATEAMAAVKRTNLRPLLLRVDGALLSRYGRGDINTGE